MVSRFQRATLPAMQTHRSKHRYITYLFWLLVALFILFLFISALFQLPAQAALVALLDEDFEGVAGSLQTAVDENIPASILGWTHTTPPGWSIDNSNMPATPGTTEWQGWSFTTKTFWVAADTQGRENFTLATNIIAVADPDEWDDTNSAANSGNFDSVLLSPSIAIAAGQTTYLSFNSHYRQEDFQIAEFAISWDGGPDQVLLRYDNNPTSDNLGGDVQNRKVELIIPAPANASNLVLKWRLVGANDWFWAIDDVKLNTDPPPTATPAPTLTPTDLGNKRVLYIGIDGLRGDSVAPANTPNMDALIAGGAVHTYLTAGANIQDTSSAPGWSTLLTGVWATKHNVFNNGQFGQNNYAQYPHFFSYVKQAVAGVKTASIVHWGPINDNIVPAGTDVVETYASDGAVASRVAQILGAVDAPHVTFVHFDDVDHAGHACCYSPSNANYLNAIANVDAYVGVILTAVQSRPNYANEDWLILVASDHGGSSTGHGGQSVAEQGAFLLFSNSGTTPYCQGALDGFMTQTDVVGHIFDFLDIAVSPAWGWDGRLHETCSPSTNPPSAYSDTPASSIAIADNVCGPSAVVRIINVPDSLIISDLDYGFNADHVYRSDIEVTLESPAETSVKVIQRIASTNIDNFDVQLDDEMPTPLNDGNIDDTGAPIYDRVASPSNSLSVFDGENAQGDWTITICDVGVADVGSYNQSRLFIRVAAAVAPHIDIAVNAFDSSDVDLSWGLNAANCGFNVHRAASPYFTPDSGNVIASSLSANVDNYSVAGDLGDVGINYFYRITSNNCNGMSTAVSNEVGEFDYAIKPGQ